jgi:hypothetical protein
LIGAEVDMGAEECAGVRLEEAGDALGQRHPRRERVTGSGPGGERAPEVCAPLVSRTPLSFGKRSYGLLPVISAALMAPIEVPMIQSRSTPASCSA